MMDFSFSFQAVSGKGVVTYRNRDLRLNEAAESLGDLLIYHCAPGSPHL
jgi:hypothetical protein